MALISILLAGAVFIAIGAFWYSPSIFGKKWMQLQKRSEKEMKELRKTAGPSYAGSFLAALLMAYILRKVITFLGITDMESALTLSFWLWLGFSLASNLPMALFERRPAALIAIDMGYVLFGMLGMTAVLISWI